MNLKNDLCTLTRSRASLCLVNQMEINSTLTSFDEHFDNATDPAASLELNLCCQKTTIDDEYKAIPGYVHMRQTHTKLPRYAMGLKDDVRFAFDENSLVEGDVNHHANENGNGKDQGTTKMCKQTQSSSSDTSNDNSSSFVAQWQALCDSLERCSCWYGSVTDDESMKKVAK